MERKTAWNEYKKKDMKKLEKLNASYRAFLQGLSTGYKDEGGIYGPFRNILRLDMAAFLHRWHDVFGV